MRVTKFCLLTQSGKKKGGNVRNITCLEHEHQTGYGQSIERNPLNTVRKLNVYKTLGKCPGQLLKVLITSIYGLCLGKYKYSDSHISLHCRNR